MASTTTRSTTRTTPGTRSRRPAADRARPRRSLLSTLFGGYSPAQWTTTVLVLLILILLVRPMVMSLLSYQRTASLLSERRTEVAGLRERNAELERRLEYYRTSMFVQEQARKYGLTMPGEYPFVIREIAANETRHGRDLVPQQSEHE